MQIDRFIDGLLDYLRTSPTPFHAVRNGAELLEKSGFSRLDPGADPHPPTGPSYLVHGDSSLIAFHLPAGAAGLRLAGAHTDSPGLKVKLRPEIVSQGCAQVGVEVYGGALLNPWFDRDLSLAGRVCWLDGQEVMHCSLVDFRRPLAVIPSLAIHLDREANQSRSINKQTDLIPVLGPFMQGQSLPELLLAEVQADHPAARTLLDFDLFFYDCQPPARVGPRAELLCGARLDNLVSCYALLRAMADTPGGHGLIVLNDHEEVGSVSATGAQGPFLKATLERLFPEPSRRRDLLENSLFLSADNAHAAHPNFAGKYDPQHLPLLNQGLVLKQNAGQRYATNAVSGSLLRRVCREAGVPVQDFVMRNDLACGSTIGPLTAAEIGVATVDIGIPSLAMHSIRETAGTMDCWHLYRTLSCFFSLPPDALTYQSL